MAESYADEEARISKACDALERFDKPNIARAARDFHVTEKKLRNRFNGIPSKSEYGGHNKTLTDDQELAVVIISIVWTRRGSLQGLECSAVLPIQFSHGITTTPIPLLLSLALIGRDAFLHATQSISNEN